MCLNVHNKTSDVFSDHETSEVQALVQIRPCHLYLPSWGSYVSSAVIIFLAGC
jgi:hypothetical protein